MDHLQLLTEQVIQLFPETDYLFKNISSWSQMNLKKKNLAAL